MVVIMYLIDTHAHLHTPQFDPDRKQVLERAALAGVARIIEIGYDLESSRAAIAFAEQHAHIQAVVGIQPNHAAELPADWLAQVAALAAHPKVVGIGEIGFDYYWNKATPEQQEAVFRAQLNLARELHLPVVIHTREAQADTLRVLQHVAHGQPGIMHSFSGDWAFAEACLAVGFMLSFSGPISFPKALDLHEVVRRVPANRILSETDSPYLAPQPVRGKRNEPAYVRHVVERLAQLRGVAVEEIAAQVWQNATETLKR
jgi:TatD DNase family protein